MLILFACIALVLLSFLAASLRPVYGIVPLKEIKRQAHKGDTIAATLYQVSRHGLTADLLLLVISLATSSLAFVLIASSLPLITALVLIACLIFLIFNVFPKRTSKLTRKIALGISPYLAKLLIKLRPITNRVSRLVRRRQSTSIHTGLYEKEDLLELLKRQKIVPNNRIEPNELDFASHALGFSDKKVGDYMIPRRLAHFVSSEEPIGPILLSELYDTGFSRFPVLNHEKTVVGTLFLKDLADKRNGGIVSNVMSPAMYYVNKNAPLEQVLAAFAQTKHLLFIVVNAQEKVVGIITMEDVLEQMTGRKLIGNFDQFDDVHEVASYLLP